MRLPGDGWQLSTTVDATLEDQLTTHLVEYNQARSAAIRERFHGDNLAAESVHAFVLGSGGALIGGCTARVERVWHWLDVDTMWVDEAVRGRGLGLALLRAVEDEGRRLGCRWSEVTTFDFQAPGFYRKAGYVEYGVKHDYPPGHTNHYLRKEL
ncbi:GNAT family N-acetyltransferase [Nocardioides sp. WL0053]|uniref:GNAT family N-acetyltransferase n=1 Tax=Nocardioides jiangsuensis TaxID=2866161 RepID=A0ABS7RNZ8_9ACTN|nr:GNAT family N-acetyltransferase [Nocardioides jiangsuensis]MBY9076786.1 GNAT family N-acetyltransferase [Nocardioides jiangsuensis]